MTRSEMIEHTAAGVVFTCVAVSFWKANWSWPLWAAIASALIGTMLSARASTRADHARRRRRSWLIPVVALAVAAPMAYFAEPAERPYALAMGGALVLAGAVLACTRRRAI